MFKISTPRPVNGEEAAEAYCGCVAVFREQHKPPAVMERFDRRCKAMVGVTCTEQIAKHLDANTDEGW